MGPKPAGMYDPLRDPLMVEVEYLLAEMEVLKQGWSPRSGLQRILVVGDRRALLRCQYNVVALDGLMSFSTLARVARAIYLVRHKKLPPKIPDLNFTGIDRFTA